MISRFQGPPLHRESSSSEDFRLGNPDSGCSLRTRHRSRRTSRPPSRVLPTPRVRNHRDGRRRHRRIRGDLATRRRGRSSTPTAPSSVDGHFRDRRRFASLLHLSGSREARRGDRRRIGLSPDFPFSRCHADGPMRAERPDYGRRCLSHAVYKRLRRWLQLWVSGGF